MADPASMTPVCPIEDARVLGADPYLDRYLDHPEGVAVGSDGTVYAGGEDGQVYRVDPADGTATQLADTGGFPLCLTLDAAEETLYVCDFQEHAVFRVPLGGQATDGVVPEAVVRGTEDERPIQPNYAVFDSDGRLFLSDSGDRTAPLDQSGGCVMAVEPDGSTRVLTEALSAWTNGLALSQDESTLYVAETGVGAVSAVHLDDGGGVDRIELVTDEVDHVDGIALDAADDLYLVSIGDDAVYRLGDDGLELVVHDPVGLTMCNPTNVAFGGPDMETMYVANLGLPHLTVVGIDRPGRFPTVRHG